MLEEDKYQELNDSPRGKADTFTPFGQTRYLWRMREAVVHLDLQGGYPAFVWQRTPVVFG
ncbi:hypothetical protein CCMA1212_006757 [Trichoderma ghanense]|uniref:Uncharacterized protein n=1 Tax=Trichoderma ghanense TaxID=65468 RepID=A0ABY2H1C0_9HYPO